MNGNLSRRILRGITAALCAVTVWACSSPAQESGTNTNWVHCAVDADCADAGAAAACVEGLCRTPGTKNSLTTKSTECPPRPTADASAYMVCSVAKAYVTCTNPNGSGEICTTDGEVSCSGGAGATCKNGCAANEYVASCGHPGPGPVPEPPPNCRQVGVVPAGVAFYCCPCSG